MAPIIPKNRNRLQAWQEAAVSCGLQVLEASGEQQPRLAALAGRLWVRIETWGEDGQSTRVSIVAPGSPDFIVVRIRPEPSFHAIEEIEIGDKPFDSTFLIQGPVGMVLALLGAETRRLLLRLSTETRLEIAHGGLRAENDSDEEVLALLPRLLEVGQRLAQPPDVPRRLAENVRQDPEARVRLQNLLALISDCSEEPETAEALRAACSDSSPEIRLRAAKALGSEGRDVLLEIAEGGVDDTLSAEAVSALGRELPFEPAKAILDRARDLRHLKTAHACVEALGLGGGAAAVDPLARILAQEKGELAAAAVQALGATGSPAAEPPLILALQHEERDLRIAAANALGRAGSTAAVLPLKETAERSWLDRELRRTARQAITEIQSRLQGASPGQLSLAGAEAGQLSLAQAEAGQLSLSGDDGADDETPGEA